MLEVHIPSVGPEAEGPRQSPEKGHMVSKWTKSACGDLPNILATGAKGTQNSGLGHSLQRFGVTWLCQSLGQWSGLLKGRVEQRGGPVILFFQVCVGLGRGVPDGGTPSRLCAFQTPEIGRVSRRGSYCILWTHRPHSSSARCSKWRCCTADADTPCRDATASSTLYTSG